jgi:hypothetical protein
MAAMAGFRLWCKRAIVALAVFLVAGQLVRPARTNPPVTAEVDAPEPIRAVLRRACYDCHSNATVWPWYAAVAPVSWLVAHDVDEGRDELNFSTWDAYAAKKRAKKMEEIVEVLEEDEMPLWYYVLLHPEARLTDAERAALEGWARGAPPAGG